MKIATFDVDVQKGFTPLCPEELPVPEGHLIVPELQFMATMGSIRMGSKDAHPEQAVWTVTEPEKMLAPLDFPDADLTWVKHCVPGTPGFELLDDMPHPSEYDLFVWKGMEPDLHPYGACYHDIRENLSTGVIEFLREREVDLVIVGGLAFDFCVKTTVEQLSRAGFAVVVYLPATRALTERGYHDTAAHLGTLKNVRIAKDRAELAAYRQI